MVEGISKVIIPDVWRTYKKVSAGYLPQ